MDKEEKVENLVPAAPDLDKPPEGISQEDWDDLSKTEQEGVLDTEEEEPADELTPEQLAEIAKVDEPPAKTNEELAVEAAPPEPAAEAPPSSEVPEADLLRFRATVADSELPPIDFVPDELQDKLDELDETYEAEEITLAEYNKARDAINRGIVMQNIQTRDAAKSGLIWEKEQAYFLRSRPIYLEKSLKGSALFGALGEAVKSLGADPKYASASGVELLAAADKAVREAFGMTKATPVVRKEEKPASPLPKHQTLGDIPPAAPNSTDGAWAGLDKLSGQAYEDALEKLSPEVRDRYLNSR